MKILTAPQWSSSFFLASMEGAWNQASCCHWMRHFCTLRSEMWDVLANVCSPIGSWGDFFFNMSCLMSGISEHGVGATFCHLTAKLKRKLSNTDICIPRPGLGCGVLILSFSFHRWTFALNTCHVGVNYMLLRHTLYGAGLIYWGDSKFWTLRLKTQSWEILKRVWVWSCVWCEDALGIGYLNRHESSWIVAEWTKEPCWNSNSHQAVTSKTKAKLQGHRLKKVVKSGRSHLSYVNQRWNRINRLVLVIWINLRRLML